MNFYEQFPMKKIKNNYVNSSKIFEKINGNLKVFSINKLYENRFKGKLYIEKIELEVFSKKLIS